MESENFDDTKKMTADESTHLFTFPIDLPDADFPEQKNMLTNSIDISFEFIAESPKEIALLISSMAIENLPGGEMTGARKLFVQYVGKKIATLRKSKNYTQQELAEKLNLKHRKSIMDLEQNHRKTSGDVVENISDLDKQLAPYWKIADFFKIPIDDLFEEAKKVVLGLEPDLKPEKVAYSPERFGRIIKALRCIEEYTQTDLAKKINCDRKVDRRVISDVEKGKYNFNKISGFQDKILAVFHLSCADLFK